jgi:hypothetical protein
MATELPGFMLPGYTASADLRTSQYRAVKLTGVRTVGPVAAITDKFIGVLQNTPNTTETAQIMVSGRSKVEASAAITAGATVGVSANGRAVTIAPGTDTTQYILGIAEDTCANAGEIISVLLPGQHARAS